MPRDAPLQDFVVTRGRINDGLWIFAWQLQVKAYIIYVFNEMKLQYTLYI